MRYDAVLFDLDGTLIDSMSFWIEAYLSAFKKFDVIMTPDEFIRNVYLKHRSLEDVLEEHEIEDQETWFREMRDAAYCNLLEQNKLWFEDAKNAFPQICKRIPVGIVTASWKAYVDAVDRSTNIATTVKTIITTDDTQGKGKPDPYGLHLCAQKMQVKPENCVYVGDLMVDVQAAKNAGMTSCLIRRSHTPDNVAPHADYVLDSLEDLISHIGL